MDSADEAGSVTTDKKATGACASCHRRKLKCDRMPICSNCKRSDIPCVYTTHPSRSSNASTTRDGRKKVRGPYKKGRTVREKELEHVVELLQDKCTVLEAQAHSDKLSPGSSHGSTTRSHNRSDSTPAHIDHVIHPFVSFNSPITNHNTYTSGSVHPSTSQILEHWLIYTTAVDPVTKILHCPTFQPTLLEASHNTTDLSIETESQMLAIYIGSLTVLESHDVQQRFSQSKETLMTLYSTTLHNLLQTASETESGLAFETLQALVMYMCSLRRQPGTGEDVISLFSLAVTSGKNLGLDRAVTYLTLNPLDAELRRRAWWTICRHESAAAEEVHTRKQSIIHDCEIPLPKNLDDRDIDAGMTVMQMPRERVGVTGMSFVLMMMEIVRLVGSLSKLLNGTGMGGAIHGSAVQSKCLKEQSRRLVEETRTRMDSGTLQHCDTSRPFDWLLLVITKVLLTKVEIMLLSCSPDSDVTAINTFHDIKVALSLDIIECHQLLLKEEKMKMWRWNYRNTQQWYAMIYVLEETARRPDAAFASRVWQVADVVFADMDVLNKHGMKSVDRDRMLEVYGRAIEAKQNLLNRRDVATAAAMGVPASSFGMPEGTFVGVGGASTVPDYTAGARSEPWQIDQSLFDVQEAELANLEDAFFWPSS